MTQTGVILIVTLGIIAIISLIATIYFWVNRHQHSPTTERLNNQRDYMKYDGYKPTAHSEPKQLKDDEVLLADPTAILAYKDKPFHYKEIVKNTVWITNQRIIYKIGGKEEELLFHSIHNFKLEVDQKGHEHHMYFTYKESKFKMSVMSTEMLALIEYLQHL